MQDYTGREEVISEQAQQLPATERAAYLERACGGNAELRRRVEGLLAARASTADAADIVGGDATDNEWPTGMPRPAIPGQHVGPYKLLEEIGEGGGGKVFLAEQEEPVRRRVALKIIKLGMDTEEVIARFEAERQALAMMDHPNIARVLDAGATPTGRPYFVMELVKGVPITQFCDEFKLTVAERLKLFILVCNAVQHAHQKGIIHRDIKPSNILVAMNDGVPSPKVIDFGIAKATGGRLTDKTYYTVAEQFVGTPAYMSPEQAAVSNVDVDTRSDIYSLGVLLYELLAGCTPIDQEKLREAGVDEVRRNIREEEPPRPSARLAMLDREKLAAVAKSRGVEPARLIASVRGDLDWIVMRCLEKDRQRRYETASALALDLRHYLDSEPVSARPPSALYLLQKMARRHSTLFASGAAVAAALVIGLGAALWSAHQERVQRTRADEAALEAKAQSERAQTAEADTKRALSSVDYLIATSLAQEDRLPGAVAHLVRALGDSPNNESAATLLYSLLTMRNWLVPSATQQTTVTTTGRGGARGAGFPGRGGPQGFRGSGTRGSPGGRGGAAETTTLASQNGSRSLQFSRGEVSVFNAGSTTPNFPAVTSVVSANISADGRWVVLALQDHTARLIQASDGQSVAPPMRIEGDFAYGADSVSITPDDRQVITKSYVLDPAARKRVEIEQTWNYVENPALLAVYHVGRGATLVGDNADGHLLLAISQNAVELWNTSSDLPTPVTLQLDEPARAAVFSPDGKRVATLTANSLRIWDAATGKPVTAAIADDGARSGGQGNRAQLGPGIGFGRPGQSARLAFSPDGAKVLLLANDRTVRVIDAATGKEVFPALRGEPGFSGASFSPDGKKILTLGASVQIWDAATGAHLSEFSEDAGTLDSASFSPDGKLVLTTSGPDAQVWDVATGQADGDAIRQGDQNIAASFSPDGTRILTYTTGQDGAARVWDAATGQPKSALMHDEDFLQSAAFSPSGGLVLTTSQGPRGQGGAAPSARVWDATSGLPLSLAFSGTQPKFSHDGSRLYIVAGDAVQVWPFCEKIEPGWILEVAQTLARTRLDATGSAVFDAGKSYDDLRHLASQTPDAGQPMALWAKRLLGLAPAVGETMPTISAAK